MADRKPGDEINAHYRGRKGWGFYFELEGGELVMLVSAAGGPKRKTKNPLIKGDLCKLVWAKETHFEGWMYSSCVRRGSFLERLSFYNFLFD